MDMQFVDRVLISGDATDRLTTLMALFQSKENLLALISSLTECLKDTDEAVVHLAMLLLERCGIEGGAPLAEILAPSQTVRRRMAAAVALGRMGPDAAAAVGALGCCLEEENEELRSYAVFAMGRIGSVAMDVLLRSLNAADDKIKLAALEAMGAMGSKAQPAGDKIRSLMNGAAPLLATACAGCLAKIDVKDPQGLSRLLAALGDPDEEVRRAAVRLVGELTSRDIDALPQLMGSLGDPSAKVRAAAALAIARVKPDAVEAVEPLTPLLADSDPEVLINAAIALGTIGPPASAASSALQALGQHSDSRVVDISRAALQRIITQGGTKV